MDSARALATTIVTLATLVATATNWLWQLWKIWQLQQAQKLHRKCYWFFTVIPFLFPMIPGNVKVSFPFPKVGNAISRFLFPKFGNGLNHSLISSSHPIWHICKTGKSTHCPQTRCDFKCDQIRVTDTLMDWHRFRQTPKSLQPLPRDYWTGQKRLEVPKAT